MGAHKFDPSRHLHLDSNERSQILPVEDVMGILQPLENLTVIDVGCGTGYFTVPFSQEVGPQGIVYAADTSEEMLTLLKERIPQTANLVTVLTEESYIPLEDGIADMIFMSAVYHEFDDRPKMVKELIRLAKPDARFIVIDWNLHSDEQGPPLEHRVPKEIVVQEFTAASCHLFRQFEPGANFYGLIFCRREKEKN
ncbi:class I SAM-dependent methyltransferase [Candidatus Neomarinimicrobiota bacterium]